MKTKTWKEFDKQEFPKEKWLIEHLLPREGIVIIASPSGEKKTWIAMEMARCIADGRPFLGYSEFKAEQGNVLYIDEEMPEAELQRRGKLLGLEKTSGTIFLANRNRLNLNNDEEARKLFEFLFVHQIKAVFIDTLRAIAGGLNEDKAEDVRMFFNRFSNFKNHGVALVFLDHCRKPSHSEGKLPKKEQLFGSQDKLASVETLLMVRSEERSDEIQVHHKKSRSGREYEPFKIEMKEEVNERLEATGINLCYGGKLEEKEYKVDQAKNAIMDFVSKEGKTRKDILNILFSKNKIGEKNASDALRSLVREGHLQSEKTGRENLYKLNIEHDSGPAGENPSEQLTMDQVFENF